MMLVYKQVMLNDLVNLLEMLACDTGKINTSCRINLLELFACDAGEIHTSC